MLWAVWLNGARYVLARQVYQNLDLPSALFGQVVVWLREQTAGAPLDHLLHLLRSPHCTQRDMSNTFPVLPRASHLSKIIRSILKLLFLTRPKRGLMPRRNALFHVSMSKVDPGCGKDLPTLRLYRAASASVGCIHSGKMCTSINRCLLTSSG